MHLKDWKKNIYIYGIIGIIQFILLTGIAMIFYAGGTIFNHFLPGYSFWFNYISDLGMTIAWSGASNLISKVLFSIAILIMSITMFFSFLAMTFLFMRSKKTKWFSIFGTCFALISAIGFIGLVFASEDSNMTIHLLVAAFGYGSIFLTAIFYSIAIFLDKDYPNRYAVALLVMVIALFIFILLILIGPGIQALDWAITYAIPKK